MHVFDLDVLVASRYFSGEDIVNSLSLIIEDSTGLGLVIFSFALMKGFPHKNIVLLIASCLIIIFHCIVSGGVYFSASLTI
jgi:hypothetical protein